MTTPKAGDHRYVCLERYAAWIAPHDAPKTRSAGSSASLLGLSSTAPSSSLSRVFNFARRDDGRKTDKRGRIVGGLFLWNRNQGTTQTLGLAHPPRFLTIRPNSWTSPPRSPPLPFLCSKPHPPAGWREIGQTRMHDSHGATWATDPVLHLPRHRHGFPRPMSGGYLQIGGIVS